MKQSPSIVMEIYLFRWNHLRGEEFKKYMITIGL
jgi:hypothetical protein